MTQVSSVSDDHFQNREHQKGIISMTEWNRWRGLCAAVLLFLLLTSCGQQPEGPAITAAETTFSETETTAAATTAVTETMAAEAAAVTTATETEPAATEPAATDADSAAAEEYLGGWLSEDGTLSLTIVADGSRFAMEIQGTGDPLETGTVHELWDYQPTYQDGKLVSGNGRKSTNMWSTDANGQYSGKSDVLYENGKAEFLLTPEGILWKNLTEEDMPDILFNDHLVQ
jgi:hypothetical protein